MPTFANTIDNNEILAKRSQCDYAGNDIQTTYATKTEVTTDLAAKQDTISDLATIRSGAAAGATAVQPGDLAAVATTGAYSDLSGTPTIPSGVQLVPAATSADADKVLTVDAQGTPGWATPSGGGSVTDVEVNGTSVVNASGVAEVTVPAQVNADWNSSSGASEILNKPTIPAAQVNSDWNASSGVAEILNKPTILPYKPVVAGTGVRIVDDTANNRIVVEADETVLWKGSIEATANNTATVSESPNNFEYLRFEYHRGDLAATHTVFRAADSGTAYGRISCSLDTVNIDSTQNNVYMFTGSFSGTTFTVVNHSTKIYVASTFSTSTTSPLTLTKIIGINHVASN